MVLNDSTLLDGWTIRAWMRANLAGTWVNTVFFTLETWMFVLCIRHLKLRPWCKTFFYFMFLNDAFGSLALYSAVFKFFVLSPDLGTQSVQPTQPQVHWSNTTFTISLLVSTVLGQLILAHQYWLETRCTIWSVYLLCLVATHMAVRAIAAKGAIMYSDSVDGFQDVMSLVTIICAALTDSIIAISLVLVRLRLTCADKKSRSHFWALCLDIVSSGAVTASMSLLMVVLVFQAIIPLSTFFFAFTPRLYALTVLSNFFTDRSPYSIQQAMNYQGREHGRRVVETSSPVSVANPRLTLHERESLVNGPSIHIPVKEPVQHRRSILIEKSAPAS